MNRNTNLMNTTCLKEYLSHNNTTIKEPSSSSLPSSYANNNKNHQMVKNEFWDSNNNNGVEDHHHYMMNGGFPWPPRSYTCSFCRKEFKSAQALGGHMNVHRRDRARLRQSPPITTSADHNHAPILNLNLNQNPSSSTTTTTSPSISTSSFSLLPSSSSSSSSISCAASHHKPAATSTTLPLFSSSPNTPSTSDLRRWVVMDGVLVNPLSKHTSEPTKQKKVIAGYDGSARGDGECKILKRAEILRVDLEIGLPRGYDLDLELRLGTYS